MTGADATFTATGRHTEAATASPAARELNPSEVAWLAAVPVAALTTAAVFLLGPMIGRGLMTAEGTELWPSFRRFFRPEPVEQGRFLVALAGPLVLAGLIVLGARRPLRIRPPTVHALVTAAQALLLGGIVACFLVQRSYEYRGVYADTGPSFHQAYFSPATLVVAALLTAAAVACVRSPSLRTRLRSWTRETRARTLLAAGIAGVATTLWLLHAFNTETTVGLANPTVLSHLLFPLDETFSVLDGRTPLVDFAPLYGFLWPYVFAAGMWLLDDSIGVYLGLAQLATAAGMLAVYAVLRRAARSAVAALALFLPFLATSFFLIAGPLVDRFTFATLPGTFPMRYAGPFLLLWLLARHLDGARPRGAWWLFLVAGVVVLNNPDTGIPALGATLAALLWAGGARSRATLARLAIAAVAGLATAFALVSVLTLVRTGSLPDLGLLFFFPRAFAAVGFYLLPMPAVGLHLVLYATFVAALAVATARAVRDEERLLTGLLAFSGVFGLGVGAYFAGRSHPDSLIAIFPAWAFALALLTVLVLRELARQQRPRPSLAQLACLFGFALAACSLAQTPAPWQQLERLSETTEPWFTRPTGHDFVARHTQRDEPVLVLLQLGHRIAFDLGIDNVSPYNGPFAMPLPEQLELAVERLREAGGSKVFLRTDELGFAMPRDLAAAGFARRDAGPQGLQLWVDQRQPTQTERPAP